MDSKDYWNLQSGCWVTVNTGGCIQRLLKTNIITLHNSLQVHVKFSCSEKSFHIFHFIYIFKTNMTELINESADVCLHFKPCDVTGL